MVTREYIELRRGLGHAIRFSRGSVKQVSVYQPITREPSWRSGVRFTVDGHVAKQGFLPTNPAKLSRLLTSAGWPLVSGNVERR